MAAVVAVLVGLTACTGEDDPGLGPTSSVETTTPTPSSTPTPSAVLPTLPPEAMTQDATGAEAFVRHWFDLVNYGYMSAESEPMLNASNELCLECDEYETRIERATENGDRLQGPALVVLTVTGGVPDGSGRAPVEVTYDQPATVVLGADGEETTYAAQGEETVVAFADFKEGSWSMTGLALPDS